MEHIPGRVMAAARVMAGLKMAELSELCGASTRTLLKLENRPMIEIGDHKREGQIAAETVERILKALRKEGVEIIEDGFGVALRHWPS